MTNTKEREAHFHDELRGELLRPDHPEYRKYTQYRKWYLAPALTGDSFRLWMEARVPDKDVLDLGSGLGGSSVWLAGAGARVKAVDISPVSVEKTMSLAVERGLANKVDAIVGDAEALPFPEDSFDVVWVSGVLHHTDVAKVYAQISRVLRPTGFAVMTEALGHNPAINYYRKRTPYLRSPDEHPLKKSEVMMARQYFAHVEFRFLYLASLAAVPFQGLPGARLAIRGLDICDAILLRVPGIRWHAWQVRMIARSPIKGG